MRFIFPKIGKVQEAASLNILVPLNMALKSLNVININQEVKYMNYQEFINAYNGKATDYDGAYGAQCVDLIKAYLN